MALDFEDAGPANDVSNRGKFAGCDRLKLTPQVRRQIDAE